eukprot:GHVQ01007874.1.p1 GENE.GHVQ01007874.1~~GHVQ01007874.1.p1  ORF type:complete len:188 (+),score=43.91 GHVQ01007874.1:159-722(+)
MAGFDEAMQQMRRMQADMNRMMMNNFPSAMGGGAMGGGRDPFGPSLSLMDRDPLFGGASAITGPTNTSLAIPSQAMPLDVFRPSLDVLDMGDKFSVHADLPGMQKQDVKVDVKDGMLNISAEHREDKKRTEGNWVVQERKYGKFHRSLKLPENVKEDQIKARFNEGVLELDLPKEVKALEGKQISIQ